MWKRGTGRYVPYPLNFGIGSCSVLNLALDFSPVELKESDEIQSGPSDNESDLHKAIYTSLKSVPQLQNNHPLDRQIQPSVSSSRTAISPGGEAFHASGSDEPTPVADTWILTRGKVEATKSPISYRSIAFSFKSCREEKPSWCRDGYNSDLCKASQRLFHTSI